MGSHDPVRKERRKDGSVRLFVIRSGRSGAFVVMPVPPRSTPRAPKRAA